MKFGIAMFPADYAIRPDEMAAAVEARGFESLFFPEHTHIPASEASREQTRDLEPHYYRTFDLFTSMSYAAAATTTLLVGSGICLLPQHEPIVAAKAIASIDQLSGGRVLFGIGAGWIHEELENFGFAPDERWAVMKDRMLAMKQIWANDIAEYHGRYRDFGPIYSWPKPVTSGGPPIIIGGNGPNVTKRVADYGDVWMPNDRQTVEELSERMAQLQQQAAARGRGEIPVTIFGTSAGPAKLEQFMEAGVDRVLLRVNAADRDTVLPILDDLVKMRDSVLGK